MLCALYISHAFLPWLLKYLQSLLHLLLVRGCSFLLIATPDDEEYRYCVIIVITLKKISTNSADNTVNTGNKERTRLDVFRSATAVALSFTICKAAALVTKHFGFQGGSLPCITAIIVVLATIFPAQCGSLAPAGEAIALILMQVNLF